MDTRAAQWAAAGTGKGTHMKKAELIRMEVVLPQLILDLLMGVGNASSDNPT